MIGIGLIATLAVLVVFAQDYDRALNSRLISGSDEY